MNRYFNILILFLFVIGASSCAKEELEGPGQTAAPQAIMKSSGEMDESFKSPETENLRALPVYINDDGDEEDEGLKPTIPTELKK